MKLKNLKEKILELFFNQLFCKLKGEKKTISLPVLSGSAELDKKTIETLVSFEHFFDEFSINVFQKNHDKK